MDIKLDIKLPSFLSGMSRVLDMGCTFNSTELLDGKSDQEALKSDWEIVGADLESSISQWSSNVK